MYFMSYDMTWYDQDILGFAQTFIAKSEHLKTLNLVDIINSRLSVSLIINNSNAMSHIVFNPQNSKTKQIFTKFNPNYFDGAY